MICKKTTATRASERLGIFPQPMECRTASQFSFLFISYKNYNFNQKDDKTALQREYNLQHYNQNETQRDRHGFTLQDG